MLADRIAELERRAARTAGRADQGALLAEAAALAVDPLQQIALLMRVADLAGRAAHDAAGRALHGDGLPGARPATWDQIGEAAGLSTSTVYRQWHTGQALAWPAAARGVRQAARRTKEDR